MGLGLFRLLSRKPCYVMLVCSAAGPRSRFVMKSDQKSDDVTAVSDKPAGSELPLEDWMRHELEAARRGMFACISATGLTKKRPAFGQTITPLPGSVVAAPIDKDDKLPDYFFHWLRDSALVMDALGLLIDKALEPVASTAYLHDFVGFSLALNRLSGSALVQAGGLGHTEDPKMRPFLRDATEMDAVEGDRLFGEVRFNPNGTLDVLKWSRPQFDGSALRALTILRWVHFLEEDGVARAEAAHRLIFEDIDFLLRHFQEPCYDLWEARFGHHYHTRLVMLSAFEEGSEWAAGQGHARKAGAYQAAAATLTQELDHHWSEKRGFYLAAIKAPRVPDSNFDLDAAVLLAVLNSRNRGARHSILDPRIQATVLRLQQLFAQQLPINQLQREDDLHGGILFGRLEDDSYYGGGAFNMISLAAAEFYYHLADVVARGTPIPVARENWAFLESCGISFAAREPAERATQLPRNKAEQADIIRAFHARGDAVMSAFRRFVPASGELAEQMDKVTGAPRSANNLAWSYAAYIRAFEARSRVKI